MLNLANNARKVLDINTLALVDTIANRVGLPSIGASALIVSAEEAVETAMPFINTEYALAISMVGGVLFSIEKLVVIYLRFQANKRDRARDNRKLP